MISKHKSYFFSSSFQSRLLFVLLFGVLEQVEFGNSLRISGRKCQYGHYYSDGCVSCWCEKDTGATVCEHMTSCPRDAVKCPMGKKYRDECDNECTCYETTGAIFCREKGQCNSIRRRNTFSSKMDTSLERDMGIPNPVFLPKDDLIIEPALIIRRKSFKSGKASSREYDTIVTPSNIGSHHSSNSKDRKPHNTLLHLYEKQLKSMNEFRNYYKQYLRNEGGKETLGMDSSEKSVVAASSNHYSRVRKPFINLSINIPKKFPPIGSIFKGPFVPKNQNQQHSTQNSHNSHQLLYKNHIKNQNPQTKYHHAPRPPPSSTIVYERRYTIPVTKRPPMTYQTPPQRPNPNISSYKVTASESSTISIKSKPHPPFNPYTGRPPSSSTVIQPGIEEYAGSDYPMDLKDLEGSSEIPRHIPGYQGYSEYRQPASQTGRPLLSSPQFVKQKATPSEAVAFYTTKRPVIGTSPVTGMPIVHPSSFAPDHYSHNPGLLSSPSTRSPFVSISPKSMTNRPYISTSESPVAYQSASTAAPQYYPPTPRPRPPTPTQRPLPVITQTQRHTEPPFRHVTDRPLFHSPSTVRPISYKSELLHSQDQFSKIYRPGPNPITSRPNVITNRPNPPVYQPQQNPNRPNHGQNPQNHVTYRPNYVTNHANHVTNRPNYATYRPNHVTNSPTSQPQLPIRQRPTQAPYRTTNRPQLYSSSTRRPVTYQPYTSTVAPTYRSTTRRPPHHTQEQSGSEYHFQAGVPPFTPYDGPFVHAELNKPIQIDYLMKPGLGYQYQQNHNHHQSHPPPRKYVPQNRPKQYQIHLRNEHRKPFYYSDNNRVPLFVDKIAKQFFRKPEIFVPKFKNGKPELERVVFNHKEIIPKELILEPGGGPMKIKFSPEAEEQMAKEWNEAGKPSHISEIINQDGPPNYDGDSREQFYVSPDQSHQHEVSKPVYEAKEPEYQIPVPDYDKNYQTPEYEAPVLEPESPKSDYYDAPPTEYQSTPKPQQHFEKPHFVARPPVIVRDNHYQVPNPGYPPPKFPDNSYSPSETFEFVSPNLSTRPPAFEIPHDHLDNFDDDGRDATTIIFDSIKKSVEVPQKSATNQRDYFQHRVGSVDPNAQISNVPDKSNQGGNIDGHEDILNVPTSTDQIGQNYAMHNAPMSSDRVENILQNYGTSNVAVSPNFHQNYPVLNVPVSSDQPDALQPNFEIPNVPVSSDTPPNYDIPINVPAFPDRVPTIQQDYEIPTVTMPPITPQNYEVPLNVSPAPAPPSQIVSQLSYTGTSAEIDHDEMIRSILSMDPEIGPDAIIFKSNGETIPPTSVTQRTVQNSPNIPKIPILSSLSSPKESLKVETTQFQAKSSSIPKINLKADSGIINFDFNSQPTDQVSESSTVTIPSETTTTTESSFDQYFRELFTIGNESNPPAKNGKKPDGIVDTDGVAKIFSYELQKSEQVYHASTLTDTRDKRNDGKADNKTLTSSSNKREDNKIPKSTTMPSSSSKSKDKNNSSNNNKNSSLTIESKGNRKIRTTTAATTTESGPEADPSSSFQRELDWKSDLMSNICDVSPNSPLCYTYKSLCLLMSSR